MTTNEVERAAKVDVLPVMFEGEFDPSGNSDNANPSPTAPAKSKIYVSPEYRVKSG